MAGSFAMIVVCFGAYFVIKKLENMSNYDLENLKIFKFNKDILVEGKINEEDTKDCILVSSFKELVKIQSMVQLPIIYNKIEEKCLFIIKAGENKYSYILEK